MAIGDLFCVQSTDGTYYFRVDATGSLLFSGAIGSASAEGAAIYIADDTGLFFGNDQDVKLEYDEDGTNQLRVTGADWLFVNASILLLDSETVTLGTGLDLVLTHNGTNSLITSTTGSLIIDSQSATGAINLDLGTDTSATQVAVRNNSGATLFAVNGAGQASIPDSGTLVFGTGLDLTITHDGTDSRLTNATGHLILDAQGVTKSVYADLGTDTTATSFAVRNNTGLVLFQVDGSGRALIPDGYSLAFGGSAVDSVSYDGADLLWTHTVGDLTFDNQAIAKSTRFHLGTDTSATSFVVQNNSLSPLLTVDGAGTITAHAGGVLFQPGSATGTGQVVTRYGATATEGLERVVFEAVIAPAAVETAVVTIPANSVIISVQSNVETALTGGGTTVTHSLGTTADPDKYGTPSSDLLTQNAKINFIPAWTFLTSSEAIVLTGAATGGAADGDTALTVGTVRVRIVYDTLTSLDNA